MFDWVLVSFCSEFFWTFTSETILKTKQSPSFRKHERSIFLVLHALISLADSCSYKYLMPWLWSPIWSNRLCGNWQFIIWLEIIDQSSTMDSGQLLFQTDFRKWLFGTLFLDSRFQNQPDSVISKYQSLSNQSFKHNSANIAHLNSTPKLSFEPRFRKFIIKCYSTKNERL